MQISSWLLLTSFLVSGCTNGHGFGATDQGTNGSAVISVCEVAQIVENLRRKGSLQSSTPIVIRGVIGRSSEELGMTLDDQRCPVISVPIVAKSSSAFNEITMVFDEKNVSSIVGKYAICTCIGVISYRDGVIIELTDVKIEMSDHPQF